MRSLDIFAGGRLTANGQDVNVGSFCGLILIAVNLLYLSEVEQKNILKGFTLLLIVAIIYMQSRTGVICLVILTLYFFGRLAKILLVSICLLSIFVIDFLPYLVAGYSTLLSGDNLSLSIRISHWLWAVSELSKFWFAGFSPIHLGERNLDSDVFSLMFYFGIISFLIYIGFLYYILKHRDWLKRRVFALVIIISIFSLTNSILLGYQANGAFIFLILCLWHIKHLKKLETT